MCVYEKCKCHHHNDTSLKNPQPLSNLNVRICIFQGFRHSRAFVYTRGRHVMVQGSRCLDGEQYVFDPRGHLERWLHICRWVFICHTLVADRVSIKRFKKYRLYMQRLPFLSLHMHRYIRLYIYICVQGSSAFACRICTWSYSV